MNKHLILILLLLSVTATNAKKVGFAVDMTGQTVSPNGVHVAGDFQDEAGYEGGDWQSNTTEMTNEPGTEIYSVVVDIPAFAKYEYKYINGDQWYEVEFVPLESRVGYDFNDNRWVYVDSVMNDTTFINPVLFSGNAPEGYFLLRVKVDMQLVQEISPEGVHVAGYFQGWDPSATILYSFQDEVYEVICFVSTSQSLTAYRFLNGNSDNDYEVVPVVCNVEGTRSILVLQDTVVETVCFSECAACEPQAVHFTDLQAQARIYPNPLKNCSKLEFNDGITGHRVIMTDILGNTVRTYENCTGPDLTISRDNLKEGVYFIQIAGGIKWLGTLRLIVTN